MCGEDDRGDVNAQQRGIGGVVSDQQPRSGLAGPGIMLLSAAIFGYIGFASAFSTTGVNGQYLLFVDVFQWTLKGSAVAFVVCGLLTLAQPLAGNLLYGVFGLLSAAGLALAGLMDFLDKQHMVMNQVLIWLFVAWNGYGSWSSLRDVLAMRRARGESANPYQSAAGH